MSAWFRNLPIKSKITAVVVCASMATLLLAATNLYLFQRWHTRQLIQSDLAGQAEIIAANCRGALKSANTTAATELLNSLRARPHILHASLHRADGSILASAGSPDDRFDDAIESPAAAQSLRISSENDLLQPVILDGATIGLLHVKFDLPAIERDLASPFLIILGCLLLAALLLAVFLSTALQPLISGPILQLTATARTVAEKRDYSVRAPSSGQDEIGTLTAAFNLMLEEIQGQHAALKRSQQRTEALIHSIDGIVWECTPDTFQFTFVSRQAERILGYTPEQLLANPTLWQERIFNKDAAEVLEVRNQIVSRRQPCQNDYRMLAADGRIVWIRQSASLIVENDRPAALRGIFLDITAQKQAAEELVQLNRRLMEISRQAGMAEVATGVLHNVGNVLNSVNVSCTLVIDRVQQSELPNLARLSTLLDENENQLADFLTKDRRGLQLPAYLRTLVPVLLEEQATALRELTSLREKIDHIKEIVSMQQGYARISGVVEPVSLDQLIEDALKLNAGALARHSVKVERQFETVPPVKTDRHKVLQILLNLIRNAKYACDESAREAKRMTLRLFQRRPDYVCVQVVDNGIGIPPENVVRIFARGFTTRRDGHGFGLHSGALAAKELGGTLTGESGGIGEGAIFTLELPCEPRRPA